MKRATTLKSPKTTSSKRVDQDNPPWSEEMLGPPVLKRGRGPQKAPTKVLTAIRLDADVIAFFRGQGPGYQTRINQVLRRSVEKDLGAGTRQAHSLASIKRGLQQAIRHRKGKRVARLKLHVPPR